LKLWEPCINQTEKGINTGRALIIDASKRPAWYHKGSDTRWNKFLNISSYKIRLVVDHISLLPVNFIITPANVTGSTPAIMLQRTAKTLFGFTIRVVRDDTGYWTTAILAFVLYRLQAWSAIDYNVRRLNKKFITSVEFLESWQCERQKRTAIERCLKILKG